MQIINVIQHFNETGQKKGWFNHPVVSMWKNHLPALAHYHDVMIYEWTKRGYKNTMRYRYTYMPDYWYTYQYMGINPCPPMPEWIGDETLHASHRSNLLRKDYNYYSKFGWTESTIIPYYWPVKSGNKL